MKKITMFLVLVMMLPFLFGNQSSCSDAELASKNLSIAADNFEISRRIVFYNGITDKYILSIEGKCSVEFKKLKFEVTCKTGEVSGIGIFKKHYLGRADNVFPFIEQLDSAGVSVFHHRVIFKPQTIIPNIQLKTG